ncbi:30S ribosomal protein S14 [Mycobacterium sp. pV006]|uniref:30S ribosomal protein S14 n=1 Tax=Mycobacterium sp. pV006 TaxID=3238983 RepID=UPI00351B4AC5
MAKKSKIVQNERRRGIVARYAERRAYLKAIIKSPATTPQDRLAAQSELNRQPRDASPVRVRVRELAHGGQLPGVRKSSW